MRQTWDPVPMVNTPTWSFPAPPPGDSLQAARLGPLAAVARDKSVTDIFVMADGRVFADRGSGVRLVSDIHIPPSDTIELART